MKKFRIVYWLSLYITEWYVTANNKDAAEKRFRKLKGNKQIIDIQEMED